MQTFSRSVLRNSAFGMGAQLAIKLLSFLFTVLIVRNLGAEEFGQYAAVLAFGAMFVFIADLGLSPYTVREVARLRDEPDGPAQIAALYRDVQSLRFLLSLLAAALLIGTAWLTGRPEEMVLAIALGTIGLVIYSFQGTSDSLLAGHERLDLSAGAKVLNQAAFVGLGGLALWAGLGYFGLIFANLAGVALMTWLCWRGVRHLGLRPGPASPGRWARLIRMALPFGIIGFTLGLSYKFDTVLLNIYHGDGQTGYYNAAYSLVFSTVLLSNVINTALYPSLTRQAARDPGSLGGIYERAMRYLMLLALPVAVGGAALADQIVPFLYGEEYGPAVPALRMVIWAVPLMFASEFLGYIVVIARLEGRVARAVIVSTSINVACNLLLIPTYGYLAAAAMTVLTELVLVSQYAWMLRGPLAQLSFGRAVGRPLLAAALMGALVLLLARAGLPLLLNVAAGGLAYLGLCVALGLIGREELAVVGLGRRAEAVS